MQPRRYEVETPGGKIITLKAPGPVDAVARLSNAPRHNWHETPGNRWLEVTARAGNGASIAVYYVAEV